MLFVDSRWGQTLADRGQTMAGGSIWSISSIWSNIYIYIYIYSYYMASDGTYINTYTYVYKQIYIYIYI